MKLISLLVAVGLCCFLDQVSGNCPPGVPIFQCLQNPCNGRTCPAYPQAVCRDNYCGGCNYDFFMDGMNVTERCMNGNCPPGVSQVRCDQNPCNGRTCPAYPRAECRANYCGGCNYDFFMNEMNVTANCSGNMTVTMECPMAEGFGSCAVLCSRTMPCPTNQLCCSNGCGYSCVTPVNVTMCRDHHGNTYNVGESFANACNTCVCGANGIIACTKVACNSIPTVCPPTTGGGGFGVCVSNCDDDSSCTNGHKCCGSCPRECVEPVVQCNASGILYNVNQTFTAADGCNNCTCTSSGLVLCTRRACIDPCQDEPDVDSTICRSLTVSRRYFYDTRLGVCRNYTHGCDAGSRNNFANAEDCYTRCRPSSVCNAGIYPGNNKPTCGTVQTNYTFFGYQGTCNNISYASCGQDYKDYNVFASYRECYNTCIGPSNMTVPNPPTTNCSEGLVRCRMNPCLGSVCPNFPNAMCNASYCGRCSAHFFLSGRNVTDRCVNATPTCQDGSPVVLCARDPCQYATCSSQPGARCVPVTCGRCGYRFVNGSGHDVTRLCSQNPPLPLPLHKAICPNINSSLAGICVNACPDGGCPDGQLCCSNGCGRSCVAATYVPYYPLPRTCPTSTPRTLIGNCSAVTSCRNNSDCAFDQACCSSECGKICRASSNEYSCSSVLNAISASGSIPPPGYYTPQCSSTGRFNATQCMVSGYCWCVDVNTGRPLSSFYPRGSRPSCNSCSYGDRDYAVGESFPSIDGCNQCSCTQNANVVCTLRACLDTCSLPPETGNCRGAFPAYFYNSTSQRCERFSYGGCGGNSNRFQTISDCLNRCDNRSRCLQRRDSGPCEALSYQFFFNRSSEMCELFNYGGCQGNDNRFSSGTECAAACNPDASVPSCATVRCAIPVCDGNSELVTDDSRCCPYCRRTGCDSSTQFTCSNGTCIDRNRRCDRIKDCSDASDERNCEEECEFRCGSGECIRRSQVCDRVIDCKDASDIRNCGTRNFTGVVSLTPDLITQCPPIDDTFCTRSRNCQRSSNCSSGTVCCDNQCGGRSCMRGNTLNCPGIRQKQLSSGLLGAFVPICQEDGRFNVTQCRERYCWCVDVTSGQPVSDGVAVPEFPRCGGYIGRNNQTLSIGDSETSADGCNICVNIGADELACSHRRCMNATCTLNFNGRELKSGTNFTDECNSCNCSAGELTCTRKECGRMTAAQMMKERFNVSLRMKGDYNKISDKEDFKRQVVRKMLDYTDNTGLVQEQIEEIKVKPGSVVVQIILVDSGSTTEGANTTVIVSQMEQDFNSGVFIIRYDDQVLQPIPGGFTATSVGADDDDNDDDSGLLSWHIALIAVGAVLLFVIAILLAVVITVCVMRKPSRRANDFPLDEQKLKY